MNSKEYKNYIINLLYEEFEECSQMDVFGESEDTRKKSLEYIISMVEKAVSQSVDDWRLYDQNTDTSYGLGSRVIVTDLDRIYHGVIVGFLKSDDGLTVEPMVEVSGEDICTFSLNQLRLEA